jgi:hypothetical protein
LILDEGVFYWALNKQTGQDVIAIYRDGKLYLCGDSKSFDPDNVLVPIKEVYFK